MLGLRHFLLILAGASAMNANSLDSATAERLANLALACVHRPYPTKIGHVLNSDQDVKKAARIDACLLRLLRLALVGSWALDAGTAGPNVT
jgi:hypothetical protein